MRFRCAVWTPQVSAPPGATAPEEHRYCRYDPRPHAVFSHGTMVYGRAGVKVTSACTVDLKGCISFTFVAREKVLRRTQDSLKAPRLDRLGGQYVFSRAPAAARLTFCDAQDCGDGKRLDPEECDDGNNEAGDGCTANCNVEKDWECSGGGRFSKDDCM